jgi:hypothetical protein
VYILDEVLDWLAEDSAFFWGERTQICFREGSDLRSAFRLLALTVIAELIVLYRSGVIATSRACVADILEDPLLLLMF